MDSYKNVLPPTGDAQNFIVKEMFDDVKTGVDQLTELQPANNVRVAAHNSLIVAPYYQVALGKTLTVTSGGYLFVEELNHSFQVLQVVLATSTSSFATTSTSYQNTNLFGVITPASKTNKILIMALGGMNHGTSGFRGIATLTRNGTELSSGAAGFVAMGGTNVADVNIGQTIVYLDTPGTQTPTTYYVQAKTLSGTGTTTWGAQNSPQVMILMELQP